MTTSPKAELEAIKERWQAAWPTAIADWSPFIQLHEPTWCFTDRDEKHAGLSGSFAMIRLVDHSIVISLKQIQKQQLESFAVEILAHEIGHHVYCPADLTDNARMLARIRRGLPSCEPYAPMIGNLYADLLINDRLQRSCHRNMADIYVRLKRQDEKQTKLWQLYLRTYEILWQLPMQTLTVDRVESRVNQDALLGARLIRNYAKDWLAGAGRFACLYFPYVTEEAEEARKSAGIWCDTLSAGAGGIPDGLAEIDDDEEAGNLHPAEDPALSGLDPIDLGDQTGNGRGKVSSEASGVKTLKNYRDPFDYLEILRAAGSNLDERQIAVRYYRERATPFLIPFPSRRLPQATDPFPEGLDIWDPANAFDQIDWVSTLLASPTVIPGVTTRERLVGQSPGTDPDRLPLDLYLGVDCSGSMRDPARTLSYPILAGAVIALSALRAGAKVKVVLSGEPGRSVSTDGFVRDPSEVLGTLVKYLGTGYSFGIHRLAETFNEKQSLKRPVHILILSDYDMFSMLESEGNKRIGWIVAKEAVEFCKGGATYVLQLPGYSNDLESRYRDHVEKMQRDGWNVSLVNSMEEMVEFAIRFSRMQYQ